MGTAQMHVGEPVGSYVMSNTIAVRIISKRVFEEFFHPLRLAPLGFQYKYCYTSFIFLTNRLLTWVLNLTVIY